MPARHLLPPAAVAAAVLIAASPASATTPRGQMVRQINRVRVAHGLRPVHQARGLRLAARAHTADMLRRGYFAHTSPTGSTLGRRIVASPFVTYGRWQAGETLAWGVGRVGRARAVVRAWMRSPEHRAVLLARGFRWVGIGTAVGRFQGHARARVWTADWAHR